MKSQLGNSINIKNFNWNLVVLKKPLKKIFLTQLVQKWGPHGPRPKQKTTFFSEITKPHLKLSKTFFLTKYMFWLSYVFLYCVMLFS